MRLFILEDGAVFVRIASLLATCFLCTSCGVLSGIQAEGTEYIRGTVRDHNGRPLEHFGIHVYDRFGNVVSSAITDASGDYEAACLRPGRYDVSVIWGQELMRKEHVIAGTPEGSDFRIPTTALTGAVVDAHGKPFAGKAEVGVRSAFPPAAVPEGWEYYHRVLELTEEDKGCFSFTDMPMANVVVSVTAPGYSGAVKNIDHSKMQEEVRLDVVKRRRLQVKVLDPGSGIPLPGVSVTVTEPCGDDEECVQFGRTNSEGIAVGEAREGQVVVCAEDPAGRDATMRVNVSSEALNTVSIGLSRPCTIVAELAKANAGGVEVLAAPCSLFGLRLSQSYRGICKDGVCYIPVPPGRYTLCTVARGTEDERSERVEIDVRWKQTAKVELH